ncbi:MAG: HAD family phosphatase [Acidobacteriota bacterium]
MTAIVFDFGGVVIDWDPRYLFRKLFDGNANAVEPFLTEIGFVEWNHKQDEGRPFAVAVNELCRRFPQHADRIRAYDQRWLESIGGPIEGTIQILRSLKDAGYVLLGLTNWSGEKFPLVRSRYPFFDWFDTIVVSGEEGLAKPDPQIFQLLLQRSNRQAGECLFIDDSETNVAVARQLGFHAIRFQSSPQLRLELEGLGLLPAK